MLLSRDESQKVIERVLSYARGRECTVTVGSSDLAQTRFANNSITTSGRTSAAAVAIDVTVETRRGTRIVNEIEEEALRAAVARAEQMARYSPPDPEHMEPVGPQEYPAIAGWDQATAEATQAEFVPLVRQAVEASAARELEAAGYVERDAQALAVGNSRGNFGYHTRTDTRCSLTVRTADGTGSGWASARSVRLADLDAARIASTAIDKAVRSRKPRRLEPGRYTVILEPAAVAGLLGPLFGLGSGAFDARAAEEGRSLHARRGGGTLLGEKLYSEKVTIASNPFDPRLPGTPWSGGVQVRRPSVGAAFFGGGGAGGYASYLPARRVTWIEKGVVRSLAYSRYWAARSDAEPTPPPGTSLVMEGEDRSLDDLVASTERGLLVTNLWYIRFLNTQTVQLTGLTRDGLFLIENGRLVHPVMNFRWNESPAVALANLEAMSRATRENTMVVPALKIREFNFSSVSDAV